jgi:hypothetical protein
MIVIFILLQNDIEVESTIFYEYAPFFPLTAHSSARRNKTPPPNDSVVAHPSSAMIDRPTNHPLAIVDFEVRFDTMIMTSYSNRWSSWDKHVGVAHDKCGAA